MTIRSNVSSFVAGIAGVAVGAVAFGGVAYAANGGSFLLGKANKETVVSTLSNSAGTPLSLVAKPGYAPFRVSNAVKVPLLNADRLDNLDSTAFVRVGAAVASATNATNAANADLLAGKPESAFALATAKAGRVASVGVIPVDYNGDLVVDWYTATAVCPAGTVLTGGGFIGDASLIIGSLPIAAGSWQVASNQSSTFYAYATCVSLRGALPVGVTPLSLTTATTNALIASVQH